MSGALLACAPAESADKPEPLYVELHLRGAPVPGCEGGQWTLSWRGAVHAWDDTPEDLLSSYTSFQSTDDQEQKYKVQIQATPVVCKSDDGTVKSHASLASGGESRVTALLGMRTPRFSFGADGIATCRGAAYGVPFEQAHLLDFDSVSSVALAPALSISAEELQKGFTKRFSITSINPAVGATACTGPMTGGELVLRYKAGRGDPTVKLAGCVHLAQGETRSVSATAEPSGGQFRYWTDPPPLSVRGSGASAQVSAGQPGRSRLNVEYTVDGKSARDSLAGSTVELDSVNQGTPLPKLGLYGVDGKPTNRVYHFPIAARPAGDPALLRFSVADPGLASAVVTGSDLGIQPVRVGQTSLQAKTLCGTAVGSPVPVTIVPCDDDVLKELNRRKQELIQREKNVVKRQTDLTSDPEFDRAASEVAKHTTDAAKKASEVILIFATASASAEAKAAIDAGAAQANADALEAVGNINDAVSFANSIVQGDFRGAVATAIGNKFSKLGALSTIKDAFDSSTALGRDLGTLVGTAQELETLEQQQDAIREKLDVLWTRLRQCKQPAPPKAKPAADEPTSRQGSKPAATSDKAGQASVPVPVDAAADDPATQSPDAPPSDDAIVDPIPAAPGATGLPFIRGTRSLLENVRQKQDLLQNKMIAGQAALNRFDDLLDQGLQAARLPAAQMRNAFQRIQEDMTATLDRFRQLASEAQPLVDDLRAKARPLAERVQKLRKMHQ